MEMDDIYNTLGATMGTDNELRKAAEAHLMVVSRCRRQGESLLVAHCATTNLALKRIKLTRVFCSWQRLLAT
jgi:hypothetical protein